MRAACQAAGITRQSAYEARDRDTAFRAQWEEALQEAVDALEAAAWQRAMTGQSDRLMEMLLRAHRPEKYRETIRQEVTGADGGPVHVIDSLDDHEKAALRAAIKAEIAARGLTRP